MDTTHAAGQTRLAAVRDSTDATGAVDAARVLVAAGVPVFPCIQGSSRPLTGRGPRGASTDPDRVAWWWSRYPTTNLAIPTGALSGLDVVEVHPARGARSGFDQIRRAVRAGLVPRPGLMVATPSGGLQLYFPRFLATAQQSWTAPEPRLGFHGEGGYVLLPPSLVQRSDGAVARYRLVGAVQGPTGSVDGLALRRFVDPTWLRTQLPAHPSATRRRTAPGSAARTPHTPVPNSAAAVTDGVRYLSRPDPGDPGRRPPEVVSL
ncbi:bifunctional DNA primase/polymerase [Promicromonospora umidemergens]|nr:bifunctional DNA primase/polymerase [Promicromonospora umidemergens]